MKKFDFLTIGGLIFGLGLVFWGIAMGSELKAFINVPGLMITVGGSFGALLVNFHLSQVRQVMKITMQVIFEKNQDPRKLRDLLVHLAQKARREGLLALEDDLLEIEDPFLREGLQRVIDGLDPEYIREIMETEIASLSRRHELGQNLFRAWGSLTPAFGMIGTLIGLVQMLSSLENPEAIGPGMAVALLTTFYGVLIANLVLNPIAGKLAIITEAEVSYKEAIVDGVLSLQAGINPRILQDKIKAYLSPQERDQQEEKEETAAKQEEIFALK